MTEPVEKKSLTEKILGPTFRKMRSDIERDRKQLKEIRETELELEKEEKKLVELKNKRELKRKKEEKKQTLLELKLENEKIKNITNVLKSTKKSNDKYEALLEEKINHKKKVLNLQKKINILDNIDSLKQRLKNKIGSIGQSVKSSTIGSAIGEGVSKLGSHFGSALDPSTILLAGLGWKLGKGVGKLGWGATKLGGKGLWGLGKLGFGALKTTGAVGLGSLKVGGDAISGLGKLGFGAAKFGAGGLLKNAGGIKGFLGRNKWGLATAGILGSLGLLSGKAEGNELGFAGSILKASTGHGIGTGIQTAKLANKTLDIDEKISTEDQTPKVGAVGGGLGLAGMGYKLYKGSKAIKTGTTMASLLAKTSGKTFLKKIPLVGAAAGAIFGLQRLINGDVLGAVGEVASGVASIFPGLGTLVSAGIDGLLLAKDVMEDDKNLIEVGTDFIKSFKDTIFSVFTKGPVAAIFDSLGKKLGETMKDLLTDMKDGLLKFFTDGPVGEFFKKVTGQAKDIFDSVSKKASVAAGYVGAGAGEGFPMFGVPSSANVTGNAGMGAGGSTATGGVAVGKGGISDKFAEGMNYFMSQGWTKEQAAGIMGNLAHESSMSTTALGDKGTAFGLGQWRGDRRQALMNYAKSKGVDPSDYKTQLEYAQLELTGESKKYGYAGEIGAGKLLKGAMTTEAATQIIQDKYERPNKQLAGYQHRLQYAKQAEGLVSTGADISGGSGYQIQQGDEQYFTKGSLKMLQGLDPSLVDSLKKASIETGQPIPLTSGFRTYEEQARLYREKPGLAAKPGYSKHERGNAIDIDTNWLRKNPQARQALVNQGLDQPGWAKPWGNKPEPWHFEKVRQIDKVQQLENQRVKNEVEQKTLEVQAQKESNNNMKNLANQVAQTSAATSQMISVSQQQNNVQQRQTSEIPDEVQPNPLMFHDNYTWT